MYIDPLGTKPVWNRKYGADCAYVDDETKTYTWAEVQEYLNSGIKNAAVYLFRETNTTEIDGVELVNNAINTTAKYQGSWKI
jgi:hypothetical protein